MKHYVYIHTRHDKNEIFYVGIGTKSGRNYNTFKSNYYRAHTKDGRNPIWKKITSKTEYTVSIVFESHDYDKCKEEEIRLISLYKKKSYFGTLCNLTDGGDGTYGCEKKKSSECKFSKVIYQYDLDGNFIKEWACGKDIERELNYTSQSIYDCCNKKSKNKTSYGYQWSYNKDINKPCKRYTIGNIIPVIQLTKNGDIIREWDSASEAARALNIFPSSICAVISKRNIHNKTAGGYKWIHKNK